MCQKKGEKGKYDFVKHEGFRQYSFAHKLILSPFSAYNTIREMSVCCSLYSHRLTTPSFVRGGMIS